ncbi:MAG: OadG family protein [Clostridia bacterium]|nr:OadG family protein [Clostridia bacterium]
MDQGTLTVILIGFGVVFVGLICLIGIIYLMSMFVRISRHEYSSRRKRNAPDVLPEHSAPSIPASRMSLLAPGSSNRRAAVAAVSAAIAEYLGKPVEGIRINSIKMIGQAPAADQRRELMAVISASIAAEMGTDVSGIRIHSIKRV